MCIATFVGFGDMNRMLQDMQKLPGEGKLFEVEGCSAFLISPENTDTRDWVWYAPTLPAYPDENERWLFERFVEAGLSVAGIDVGESHGNPEGRRIFGFLFGYLTEGLGYSHRPALLSRSRGGLMLYNWAAENPTLVSCVAGIYPVCSLDSYPGTTDACKAYGMTEEELLGCLEDHNPVDRLEPLAGADVPIYHIHGDKDLVVPIEGNSGLLADRYKSLGGRVTLKVAEGEGHSLWPGFFQDQDLVDFVIYHTRGGGRRV